MSPLANSYLRSLESAHTEPFFPLCAYVCERCLLVQLEEFESPAGIFSDYAYFSSYSDSWLAHARAYVAMAVERFRLGPASHVVELASNDGYLLQYFVQRGIPVLGIEPAANVAEVARQKGIPTRVEFFGEAVARRMAAAGESADLIIGNNVLAHVPQLNDFVAGMKQLLKPQGVITLEFPHLMRLMDDNQFDTIYHEHFSYFSLLTLIEIFAAQRLTIVDVDELPTHGGSLRLYVRHVGDDTEPVSPRVTDLLEREKAAGLDDLDTYAQFGARVQETKRKLLEFLVAARQAGKKVVGYGAPAKGNTLLNYCGVTRDLIDYTVDRSPHKCGCYLPGTHLPIWHPDKIRATRPDYLLILAWNLKEEIMAQMAHVREWGCRFVVPIPEVCVLN